MNEEEKKTIEDQYKKGLVNLGNIIEPLIRQFKNDYSLDIQQLRLVTNYLLLERDFNEEYYSELDKELEKLQKEIEQLNEIKQQICNEELITQDYVQENFIKKDKIKEILSIEEDMTEEQILSYIDILVSENNRLEDIEDRKVQVEYQNVFNKGVKSVEDKIREKVKEITKYYEKEVKPEMYQWGDFTAEEHYADIIAKYNELLEK